jgi:threonine/homoserine efflux transporter RhtA
MRDVARDPAALELLQVQRSRLADRMRWPWWYQSGLAMLWALTFASPFSSRFLPRGVRYWPILVAGLAVACLLQWGLPRATGIKVSLRNLSDSASGRPARIAIIVVSFAALVTESFLIHRGLIVAAIVLAVLGVVVEVALQRAQLRAIRQKLRGGGEAA